MTKEETDCLIRRIIGIKEVMESETIPPVLKDTLKETLDDLYEKKCCCLVEVTFHLINGEKVCLDNDVSESVTRCEYHGDEIGFPQDWKTEERIPVIEIFLRHRRQRITIPLSSIVYVEMKKSNETDWKFVWRSLTSKDVKERSEYYYSKKK